MKENNYGNEWCTSLLKIIKKFFKNHVKTVYKLTKMWYNISIKTVKENTYENTYAL
jgi:hypothetical protein